MWTGGNACQEVVGGEAKVEKNINRVEWWREVEDRWLQERKSLTRVVPANKAVLPPPWRVLLVPDGPH